jgi:hypothetical protein
MGFLRPQEGEVLSTRLSTMWPALTRPTRSLSSRGDTDQTSEGETEIDGSWLFSQCGPGHIFANRMEYPDNRFKFDFGRLLDLLAEELQERVAAAGLDDGSMTPASLYFLHGDLSDARGARSRVGRVRRHPSSVGCAQTVCR